MSEHVLTAPFVLELAYTRSLGPILGAFFTGLRDGRILGARTRTARVLVPPLEYDPDTAEPVVELVEVADRGVVETWTWIPSPPARAPLDRPFAWALIRLDGADTAMLHAVDAGDPSIMTTGMRVRARWRAVRSGSMHDIEGFVPEARGPGPPPVAEAGREPVDRLVTPTRLEYRYSAGPSVSRFLRGMTEGRILGQRCPACGKVYCPPRGACTTCGVPTAEDVELAHTGTVRTFCVVHIPFAGQAVECPYVCATIRLDGADTAFYHIVRDIPAHDVRIGMRVEAVWAPEAERPPSLAAVSWFRPVERPDA